MGFAACRLWSQSSPSRAIRGLRPSSLTTRRAPRRPGCGAPTGPGSYGRMPWEPRSLVLGARARAPRAGSMQNNPRPARSSASRETLPSTGQARLERLRGFGASFGRTLTCACSRFPLADGSTAVLVIATEPAGPSLPLSERVKRLFSDQTQPLAAFAPDGMLLAATSAAQTRVTGTPTLSALGLAAIASEALAAGSASAVTDHGQVAVRRLGSGAWVVLLAVFDAEPTRPRSKFPFGHRAQTCCCAGAAARRITHAVTTD